MDTVTIRIDPEFKSLIPPLTDEEYDGLRDSLLNEGCRDALVVWDGVLVDGHNRYEICEKHGIPYDVVEMEFANRNDAIIWIIKNQFGRRNLPAYERARLALRLKPVIAERAKENQRMAGGAVPQKSAEAVETRQELAKAAGVSHDTIAKVEKIEAVATPEVKEQLRKGDMSINQAYNAIKKEERKEVIQKQIDEIEQGIMVQPDGLFDVIAIDPPWNYGTSYDAGGRRVANPYPEMTQQELKAIELPAKDDCVLFLWTTQKFIWDAKELLDAWGFTYRSMFVWDKEKIGMGDLIRMQCEFCLIGIKGKPIFKDNHGIRDIIREPRREHSRKPDSFYQIVNDLCVGRKLEYFSREQREGWTVYGNDTEKF